MFTTVKLLKKKRLFLSKKIYLRQSLGLYFTEIVFSYPKNARQRKKMYDFLSRAKGPFIYEKGFSDKFKKINEYHFENFLNRIIIYSFMHFCKETHPECCVINPCNKISESFYFTLSKFTNRIVILNTAPDYLLCQKILEFSGTPVLYASDINKASALLNLADASVDGFFNTVFDKNIFFLTQSISLFEDDFLNIYEPISFSAAVFENFNRFDLVDLWAKAVANKFI